MKKLQKNLLLMSLAILGLMALRPSATHPLVHKPQPDVVSSTVNAEQNSSQKISESENQSNKNHAPVIIYKPSPTFLKVKELESQVQAIYRKTHFDPKQMTEKEFEDAASILQSYNKEMKQLILEIKAEQNT